MVNKNTKTFIENVIKHKTKILFGLSLIVYCIGAPIDILAAPNYYQSVQQKTLKVSGTVSSEDGEPIIGANVIVKGVSTVGIITDYNGKFTLNVPADATTLVISYIGYLPKQVKIKSGKVLKIVLSEDSQMLDEVQVIAYGSQKKVTITGAVSSVNTDDILKTPVASLGNALSGKLPGLSTVQMSGMPGGDAPTLYVRGDANPLILVDGVERNFFDIDPNEVEDITILKDASATAVFGVRGANGVILVTTRRGEKGKAKVNVSTSVGVQVPTRLLDFTDSYHYALYYNEAVKNDNPDAPDAFLPDVVQAFKDGSNPLVYPNIDWMDYLMKKMSLQYQSNINISGGTDKMRYFVSLGFLSQDGMFKTFATKKDSNFKFKRYNYRANLDFDITQKTALSIGIGGRVTDKNQPAVKSPGDGPIFRQIYWATPFSGAGIDEQGRWLRSNPSYFPVSIDRDGLSPYYGCGYQLAVNNVLNVDVQLNQKLDFITKGLKIGLKGAYNSQFSLHKYRKFSTPYYTPILTDDEEVVLRKIGDDQQLGYGESTSSGRNWYAELKLNYHRKFGEHDLSALLLYNQSKNYYPGNHPEIPRGYVGLVGRLTYNYLTRYMLDFNMGYNGSENFAEGHRFGFLPAGSVGWIVSEEKFMKKIDFISYMKLRASYGVVGNDKIGRSRFLYLKDSYAFGGGYNFGVDVGKNQPGAYEGRIGNPFVTWEMAYKQNYGIDLNLFNDHLKLQFDYFYERRDNQLITRKRVPAYLAMSLPAVNLGVRENKGYEVVLCWKDNINANLQYYCNLNLAYARNRIIEMDEVRPNEEYMKRTGKPMNQPFGRKFWGFYDETSNERYKREFGEDIPDHGIALKPGDCVYEDLNKDGVIDGDDIKAIGYTNRPEYNGGLTLGFRYKRLSFSMLWNYAWNTSRMLEESFKIPFGDTNTRGLLQSTYNNRWTPENASSATLPRASFSAKKNNYANSDLWLVDADYLRLKNIEISYRFQIPALKKIGVKEFRTFVNGYNLLTFDKLKIADPEANTSSSPEYPVMKIFNVGLKIGF